MKKYTKGIALLAMAVMLLSLATGCQGKAAASADPTKGENSTSAGGAADAGEIPTIIWYQAGDKAQDHDMVMEDLNKKIVQKIGAKLDLRMIPAAEFNDKMKLISTGGEEYDITFTSGWRNSFVDNIAREAFIPLDELYAEYGKGIQSQIPEWLLAPGRSGDGKLYAIPNQQTNTFYLGLYVQKEYADKYGLDLKHIDDMREIEPFLQKLVDNEKDKIPIDFREDPDIECSHEIFLGGMWEYALALKIGEEPPKILTRSEVEKTTSLANEWYKKGFIRKDILTAVDTSADVKANRYICSINAYKPGGDAEKSASSGVDWICIPIGTPYVRADTGIATMTAISTTSKHPEAAMKMLDLVYSDKEIFNEVLFGIEGVHYTMDVENHVVPVENTKYNYGTFAWAFGNQFNAYYLPGQADGVWEETDKINRSATVSPLRGFAFDPTPVQAEYAQLQAVYSEYKYRTIVADDLQAAITERSEKEKAAGIEKIRDEFQKQVDEWLVKNKK